MKKIACNPLSCLAAYLIIMGMLIAPIYVRMDKLDDKIGKIYEYMITGHRSLDLASALPSPLNLAFARNQPRPTQ
ncbi:MAG: hypothetical protein KJ661_01130 [Candidatus Omnitrophica bacterium]|nr:hypothetical protein [Candidatus Omnitrophota bacterium]